MGRIPDVTIQEIRSRTDIVGLIGRHVELKRAGRNFKGLCPFHGEKTPSFNVNPDRQMFHCFGCGESGDAIKFLMLHEGATFPEAARLLARECGIEISETESREQGQREQLFAANEIAQALYRETLASPEGESALAYLERRGLDAETRERFGVGYAPDRWDAVREALANRKIRPEVAEKAGLLAPRKSGGHYDRLRGRVTFPVHDVQGRVLGFGGRAMSDEQEPKYLNTPETPIFRKREALYGIAFAHEAIRKNARAVVCEGYFDRIALARAGVSEAIATCGTALTVEHARQLRRRTRNVVLLFDGDAAGRKAVQRSLEVLIPAGLRVKAVALPPGHDPDDFLHAEGPEALQALVGSAHDAIDQMIQWALALGWSTPQQKSDAVASVASLIALVEDPAERDGYVQRVAVATDTARSAVARVVAAAARGEAVALRETAELAPRRDAPEVRHVRQLAALLLHSPELATQELWDRISELLPEGSWKAVILQIIAAAQTPAENPELVDLGPLQVHDLIETLQGRLDEEAFHRLRELAIDDVLAGNDTQPEKLLEDYLQHFSQVRRRARQAALTRSLRRSQSEDGSDDAWRAELEERERIQAERRASHGIGTGANQ